MNVFFLHSQSNENKTPTLPKNDHDTTKIVSYNPNWTNKWINDHLSEISSSRNVVSREQEVTVAADEQQTSGTAGDKVSL